MERRIAKLIVGKAGGTAGKDSKTYKVSLPSKWVAELGLADTKMEISFDGERIIISPQLSMDEFLEKKQCRNEGILMAEINEKILRLVNEGKFDEAEKTARCR